jgi:hypothetical protein
VTLPVAGVPPATLDGVTV